MIEGIEPKFIHKQIAYVINCSEVAVDIGEIASVWDNPGITMVIQILWRIARSGYMGQVDG